MNQSTYGLAQKAVITDIQRFTVHDGPGLRTMVFFKGCPLRCKWCQNPETWNSKPEILYYADQCIRCGNCTAICPVGAIRLTETGVIKASSQCVGCGKCAEVCYADAMKQSGKYMSVDEILAVVLKDQVFYEQSCGGMTLSGGECTLYAEFAQELLKKAQKYGIHTAIETCGFCAWERLHRMLEYTDLLLFDIKVPYSDKSIQYTGKDCRIIVENLRKAATLGKKIVLRYPMIPGVNDDMASLKTIGKIGADNKIQEIHILPFHQMGQSKWHALGRKYDCEHWEIASMDSAEEAARILRQYYPYVSIGGSDFSL